MKPYIGILIDSFWEAIGNKVLWALLIGWSLVLLALAPFGYISESSFRLSAGDIDNRSQLVEKLAKGVAGKGPAAIAAVAERLDPDFAKEVQAAGEKNASSQRRIKSSELAKQLNVVLKSEDLYSEELFPTAKRRKRLEPLIEATSAELNASELEQLNRELLQLALPLELNRPRGEQLWFGYAGFKISSEPLAFGRRQANKFVEPLLQGIIVSFGLGFVVVFVALIVTSSIIPDTFRSSSLHLLLSKPISRVWLFLSKFFGSCFFVLINLALVVLGLYLIAGFRLDIWNEGLFWTIPILLFVFVIFYSVSSLVGLLWGNAIVCVITCILFWLGCFVVGFVHQQTKVFAEVFPQLRRIVPAQQDLVTVNGMGNVMAWNEEFSVWQPAIERERFGQARTFGPVYAPEHEQLVVWSFFQSPFRVGAPSRKIQIVSLSEQSDESEQEQETPTEQPETDGAADEDEAHAEEEKAEDEEDAGRPNNAEEAREASRWTSDPGPSIPAQVFSIQKVGEEIVAVCRGGLYALDLEKLDLIEQSEKALFGIQLPFATSTAFNKISPNDFFLSDNSYAGRVSGSTPGMVIYSSGSVDWLDLMDGELTPQANTKLDGDGTEKAVVGANENYAVIAREELPLVVLNRKLEIQHASITLPREARVNQLAAIPDSDKIAILSQSGDFWELDCKTGQVSEISHPFGQNCTAMTWLDAQRVWLGVSPSRAVLYNLSESRIEKDYRPSKTTFEMVFSWLINPIYKILPKPSSLGQTMQYVLTGEETIPLDGRADAAQLELDVWEPIYSNLAFVAIVLVLSCIYVARKEF